MVSVGGKSEDIGETNEKGERKKENYIKTGKRHLFGPLGYKLKKNTPCRKLSSGIKMNLNTSAMHQQNYSS